MSFHSCAWPCGFDSLWMMFSCFLIFIYFYHSFELPRLLEVNCFCRSFCRRLVRIWTWTSLSKGWRSDGSSGSFVWRCCTWMCRFCSSWLRFKLQVPLMWRVLDIPWKELGGTELQSKSQRRRWRGVVMPWRRNCLHWNAGHLQLLNTPILA